MASNDFAGSFAAGLVGGFVKGKQMRQQQELHDAQMAKLADEKAMREDLKAASADVSPQSQFVITAADGSQMTTDTEKSAGKIAEGMDGAKISQVYTVGDQKFDTQDAADKAAFMANDPVNRGQRMAAIYNRYGHPDQAMSVMQGVNAMQDMRANESFSNINRQIASGDYAGLSKTYGALANDPSIKITSGTDGSFLVTRTGENGTPVLMHSYANADDFRAAAAGALERSPKEALSQYWLKRNFDATQDYRNKSLQNQAAGIGIQGQGLALRQQELGLKQHEMDKSDNPVTYQTGLGASGNVAITPVQRHWDPATKSFTTVIGAPMDTGVKPQKALDPFGLFGQGGLGARAPTTYTEKSASDLARSTPGYGSLGTGTGAGPTRAPVAPAAQPALAPLSGQSVGGVVTPPGAAPVPQTVTPPAASIQRPDTGFDLSRVGNVFGLKYPWSR